MSNSHLDWALFYASRGWRVFPTHWVVDGGEWGSSCSCELGPACDHTGKHPRIRRWQDAATCDAGIVTGWWTEWPVANIALVTGLESGVFAVDVDPRDGGAEAYAKEQGVLFPGTLTSMTGSGGWHLFYRMPPVLNGDEPVRNSASRIAPGIDVRGEGGYVIVPPSRHESGALYVWTDANAEPGVAPPELIARTRRPAGSGGRVGGGAGSGLPSADEILDGVPEGERNDTLFRWACQLRRKLGDDRKAVELLVREAARVSGLDQDEVTVLLESAFRQDHDDAVGGAVAYGQDGLSAAQTAWAASSRGGSGMGVGDVPGSLVGEGPDGASLPLTDLGNAYRLVEMAGGDLRFVTQRGSWLHWDGVRWRPCDYLEERTLMQRAAARIWAEAGGIEDAATQKAVAAWAKQSQMQGRLDAALRAAQPLLVSSLDDIDSHDWLFNTATGTLDLRAGEVRGHRREDLLTAMVNVAYDPAATCPLWEEFVKLVLPDPDVAWFVQKAVGYSMTGATDDKSLFILWGSGNNGKSVFLEALRENVYGEYAGVAPKTLLMDKRDEHATQLAGVAGKRFVTLSEEIEERDRLRTSTLKSVTGGDTMTARFMRQDFFEFQPKLKLWIATNHKPGVTDFGDAMKSRLRLVPFTFAIPPDRRRRREEVLDEFREEGAGILAWAVRGLTGYLAEGLESPTVMLNEVEEWLEDEDVFGQWVTECVERARTGTDFVTNADLHRAYLIWMVARGEEKFAISVKSLGKRLAALGFQRGKAGGTRGWFVRLKTTWVPGQTS